MRPFGISSYEDEDTMDIQSYRDKDTKLLDIKNEIKVEKTPGQYLCKYCGKLWYNKHDLYMHIRSTHRLQETTCDICHQSFPKTKSLENHKYSVHHKQTCGICGKTFKTPAFRKHRKSCQPSYSCQDCDYQTTIKQELHKHRKNHYVRQFFKCELCTYSSERIFDIKRHTLNAHAEKLKCDSEGCDKVFANEESLARHKEIHSPKLICNFCDHQFVRKSYLEKHFLKYHSENFIQTSSGSLILHKTENVIKEKREFDCPNCEYKSILKGNLKKHIHRMHIKPRNVVQVKDRHCDRCNSTFTEHSSLKRHQLTCKGKSIILFL